MDELGFTLYPPTNSDGGREHDVLVTRHPERLAVSPSYKQDHRGCPFDTALRPTSFREGSDAYHAPRTSNEVLIEVATRHRGDVEEYIGFLAAREPGKNGIREVKWIPRGDDQPVTGREAARDVGPSRHGLLSTVYEAADQRSRDQDASRELGRLTNNVLGEYLGTMCHDITPLYDAVNRDGAPDVQPPSSTYANVRPRHRALVDEVQESCVKGGKAWYGRGQAEDRYR